MRAMILLAAALLLSGCGDHGADHSWGLKEVWRTGNLAQPESVVYDPEREVFYISNIAGEPTAKDGKGFLSILAEDGSVLSRQWVTGLNAPKGMALRGETLYVADVDGLIEIDIPSGNRKSYPVAEAGLLNDVTIDEKGNVYLSDTFTDTIHILRPGGDAVEVWLKHDDLEAPNGLYAAPEGLYVASWGPLSGTGFETLRPGRILGVAYDDRTVVPIFEERFGNLDAIEPIGDGDFLLSDWMAGTVFVVTDEGEVVPLGQPGQGSADLAYVDPWIIVPMMMDNEVIAYQLVELPEKPEKE